MGKPCNDRETVSGRKNGNGEGDLPSQVKKGAKRATWPDVLTLKG